ncbi:MAG: hypothetical protein ACRDPE_13460 [Solirubrobacterales bacterium]
MKMFRGKLTYANVMATIAVFLVLGGGTALAAGAFTGKQKKQVGKIATKVYNARIGNASVNHANSADTATKAATATKANEATKADSATTAGKATSATTADRATSATTADRATTAGDAERFGGKVPAEYQQKLKAGCLPPSAIAGISNEGDVTCAFPVTAISANPAAGVNAPIELGNGLRLLAVCHDGGLVELAFQNVGGAAAGQLGWISGTGAGNASVGQESLPGGSGEKDFVYLGTSVEARIVYAISNQVMNINVDARDLTTSCEVRGTVSSVSS